MCCYWVATIKTWVFCSSSHKGLSCTNFSHFKPCLQTPLNAPVHLKRQAINCTPTREHIPKEQGLIMGWFISKISLLEWSVGTGDTNAWIKAAFPLPTPSCLVVLISDLVKLLIEFNTKEAIQLNYLFQRWCLLTCSRFERGLRLSLLVFQGLHMQVKQCNRSTGSGGSAFCLFPALWHELAPQVSWSMQAALIHLISSGMRI